jgi:predicted acylesterase/phospholipase RssA
MRIANGHWVPERRGLSTSLAGPAVVTMQSGKRTRRLKGESTVSFDNVVFAGGGNRCFWQAGFWSVVAPTLSLRPKRVTAVSAGSAVACSLLSGSFERGFSRYKQAIDRNKQNLYWLNPLRRQPVFPHGSMYRDAILGCIDGPALSRLHQGPEISVLMSAPPQWASMQVAFLLGAVSVGVDACKAQSVRASVGRRMGFQPLYVSVRECATPAALADLIIASSCVPPLTPLARRNGLPLFDGGLVNNVPTDHASQHGGDTLILLTRQFARVPKVAGHTYVQPSVAIPVGAWDYTNRADLQSTYDLGRRDGDAFCASIASSRPWLGRVDVGASRKTA